MPSNLLQFRSLVLPVIRKLQPAKAIGKVRIEDLEVAVAWTALDYTVSPLRREA